MFSREHITAAVERSLTMDHEAAAANERLLRVYAERACAQWSYLPRKSPEQLESAVLNHTNFLARQLQRYYTGVQWGGRLLIESTCVDLSAPLSGPVGVGLWILPQRLEVGLASHSLSLQPLVNDEAPLLATR